MNRIDHHISAAAALLAALAVGLAVTPVRAAGLKGPTPSEVMPAGMLSKKGLILPTAKMFSVSIIPVRTQETVAPAIGRATLAPGSSDFGVGMDPAPTSRPSTDTDTSSAATGRDWLRAIAAVTDWFGEWMRPWVGGVLVESDGEAEVVR